MTIGKLPPNGRGQGQVTYILNLELESYQTVPERDVFQVT